MSSVYSAILILYAIYGNNNMVKVNVLLRQYSRSRCRAATRPNRFGDRQFQCIVCRAYSVAVCVCVFDWLGILSHIHYLSTLQRGRDKAKQGKLTRPKQRITDRYKPLERSGILLRRHWARSSFSQSLPVRLRFPACSCFRRPLAAFMDILVIF